MVHFFYQVMTGYILPILYLSGAAFVNFPTKSILFDEGIPCVLWIQSVLPFLTLLLNLFFSNAMILTPNVAPL